MNEIQEKNSNSSETSLEKDVEEQKRLRWIDQGRGLVMFLLVFTITFPPEKFRKLSENIVLHFLFGHAGTHATYMTLFDVGAAAFIFVLGLSMAISYSKRVKRTGKMATLKHLLVRYVILALLGFLIVFVVYGGIYNADDGVIYWDVIPAIAVAGIVSIPFLLIRSLKLRLIVGYGWLLLYQILMLFAGLRTYAINSVHGGIFGSIFGYAACGIIATALGDLMWTADVQKNKKFQNMLLLGAVNLILGVLLSFIPGWEPSKRQVSLTHIMISIGLTVLGLSVFWYLDEKLDKDITYLRAYGMNPFLIYVLVLIPDTIFIDVLGLYDANTSWLWCTLFMVIYLAYTSVIALWLYKRRKRVTTLKAAIITILAIVALAVILIFGLGLDI
ncbi:MAG: hypothetical protein R6U96_11390 [Promethearchaeia archaeon]